MNDRNRVLFEPWGLGDALIAASVMREAPEKCLLACMPQWHYPIKMAWPEHPADALLPITLDYTKRGRASRIVLGTDIQSHELAGIVKEVITIRGDIRDYLAARALFPESRIKATGWYCFLARRIRLLDFPFRHQFMRVENRYRRWCRALGIDWDQFLTSYERHKRSTTTQKQQVKRKIVIHIGAQFRSKQYPYVRKLCDILNKNNNLVTILAGPMDPIPNNLSKEDAVVVDWVRLIDEFQTAQFVIANDSGPMHLAAFLGVTTMVLGRISNLDEWGPPGIIRMESKSVPKGYYTESEYETDNVLDGWPDPAAVAGLISKL
jgi:hypothetical protein